MRSYQIRFYQALLATVISWGVGGEARLDSAASSLYTPIHTSVTRPDGFDLSRHNTYAWDPAARNQRLEGAASAELEKLGLREVSNWREADILVGIEERRASYETQLPPVERVVYDPYGPFYPQYPHTGYRRYAGHDPLDYELVLPGYRTEEQKVLEVTIFLRHGGDRSWRGSSWALSDDRSGAESLIEEIFDEL